MYETELTVVGTLITPVDRRRLVDGTAVVHFRVASSSRRFDRANDAWTDGASLFVAVTCWRQLAENVHASFTVGDPIIVRGRLRTRSYDDKDGKRHSVTELHADAVGPDLTRCVVSVTRTRKAGSPADGQRRPTAAGAGHDDRRPAATPHGAADADASRHRPDGVPARHAEGATEPQPPVVEAGVEV